MNRFIVPAVSALLLAGLPAQAQYAHQPSIQIAQNSGGADQAKPDTSGGGPRNNDQSGGDNSKGGKGHGDNNRSDKGGAQGGSGTPSGGAAVSAPAATGSPAMMGSGGQGGTRNRTGSGGGGQNAFGTGGVSVGVTVFGTRPSNWNRYPRQFNSNVYQRNYTAPRQYHWRTYNRPSGWYYQRWVFGQIFPRMFWAQDYWLTDYWMFDLPIPPYGYVWVRYGDDALLINRRTGRVLQVVYGIFD